MQDQTTVHISLWDADTESEQTLGIDGVLGVDDDVGELDILILTSEY